MASRSQDVYALSVRLDRKLAEKLKVIAHREQMSMADVARRLITIYVEGKERK